MTELLSIIYYQIQDKIMYEYYCYFKKDGG